MPFIASTTDSQIISISASKITGSLVSSQVLDSSIIDSNIIFYILSQVLNFYGVGEDVYGIYILFSIEL